MTEQSIITPERLRGLFEPRSIVLVGASDKLGWSVQLHKALLEGGFEGKIYYVSSKHSTAHGQPTLPRLSALKEPVDLAFIMTPTATITKTLLEMTQANIRNAVILTSGFSESGEEGRQRQQKLLELANANNIVLLGPNSLGFAIPHKKIPAVTSGFRLPLLKGAVALISQSGALTNIMQQYARENNIGFSALVCTGNEAMVSIADVLSFFLEDASTKVIALFIESIGNPEKFIRAARRAQELGKPVIAVKVGKTALTARVAQSHTGAMVGDDRVIDALFKQLGIIRVNSPEELIITANLLATTGPLKGNRLGIVSISGGACDLASDQVVELGITLPQFEENTKANIKKAIRTLSTVYNPLDVTGMALGNKDVFENVVEAVGNDPNLDINFCLNELPSLTLPENSSFLNSLQGIARGLNKSKSPAFLVNALHRPVYEEGQKILTSTSMPFLAGGLQQVLKALGKAIWWSEQRAYWSEEKESPQTELKRASTAGTWSEYQTRELLKDSGISVIPATLVCSTGQAVVAAQEIGFPVVLKIVSPDIWHKTEKAGVMLNLTGEEQVRKAFQELVKNRKDVRIEGVLVSPMRTRGVELLVGVTHDPQWGQVLAVGLGGIWVEALNDVSIRLLPVSKREIIEMLMELKGAVLFKGIHGTKPAALELVADTILELPLLCSFTEIDSKPWKLIR